MEEDKDDSDTQNTASFSTGDQNVSQELEALARQDSEGNANDEIEIEVEKEEEEGRSLDEIDEWDWLPDSMRVSLEKEKEQESDPPQIRKTNLATSLSIPYDVHNNHNNINNHNHNNSNDELSLEEKDQIGDLPSGMVTEGSFTCLSPNSKVYPEIDSRRNFVSEDASYPNRKAFVKEPSFKSASFKSVNTSDSGLINFLKDDPKEMTLARNIARKVMNQKWYNPNAGKPMPDTDQDSEHFMNAGSTQRILPSLEKAWAYFEHVTLTRYISNDNNKNTADMSVWQRYRHGFTNGNEEFERAQPGEDRMRTRLYDWLSTPHKQVCSSTFRLARFGYIWLHVLHTCYTCGWMHTTLTTITCS
jgi:hypothetical protein